MKRREMFIPYLEMVTEPQGMPVRMTNLEAAHRSQDPISVTRRIRQEQSSTRRS
ncbi:hypothetical protein ACFWZ2_28895 [Streptomyces sp. NPDC059002]|uniref:hypothetical protein n=1 Tax=Streptomyces sp. NPDC059002 TaxID=3346690 RepID=UPI0036A9BFE5